MSRIFTLGAGQKGFKLVLVLALLLIFFIPSTKALTISIDREYYHVGETATITVSRDADDGAPAVSLQIESGTDTYKLFGDPYGMHKFIPDMPGAYRISVIDAASEEVASRTLSAYASGEGPQSPVTDGASDGMNQSAARQSLIYTDKRIYSSQELVRIMIDESLEATEIRISDKDNEYVLLGEPGKEAMFKPRQDGFHTIRVSINAPNATNLTLQAISEFFYVGDISMISEQPAPRHDGLMMDFYNRYISGNGAGLNAQIDGLMRGAGGESVSILGGDGKARAAEAKFFRTPSVLEQLSAQGGYSGPIFRELVQEQDLREGEYYDLEISPSGSSVTHLRIEKMRYRPGAFIGIDDLPNDMHSVDGMTSVRSFAINLDEPEFDIAVATATARGDSLYKCAAWNFTQRSCDGQWIRMMELVPGQPYTITLFPGDPGYIETVSQYQSVDVDVVALDNTTVVVATINNAAGNNASFQVWDTNGTLVASNGNVDSSGNGSSRISVTPIDTTSFVLSIFDGPQTNIDFFVYNRSGDQLIGRTTAATALGTITDIELCSLPDRFPIAYARTSNGDGQFKIYYYNGSQVVIETSIDTNMAPEAIGQNLVSCSATNSTHWTMMWFDDATNDASIVARNAQGTSVVAETDLDGNVGETGQMASAGLLLNRSAYAFYDSLDQDITITIRALDGVAFTTILANTDIDTGAGTSSRVAAAALRYSDESYFAVAWQNTSDATIKAAVYNASGAQMAVPFTVTSTPNSSFALIGAVGYDFMLGTGLCNATFAVAYTNRTGGTLLSKHWYNGSSWDGICPDTVAPVVTLNAPGNNTSIESSTIAFNFTVTDNVDAILNNCSLYANFSGSFIQNRTIFNVTGSATANISVSGISDGTYLWNVLCFDNSSNFAFAQMNFTVLANPTVPSITRIAINATLINQTVPIRINATITDFYNISIARASILYPDGSTINHTMNRSDTEFFLVFNDSVQAGGYNVTLIWANDTLNQPNSNITYYSFNVTASPPEPFTLLIPVNGTESTLLTPNLSWQQTAESDFKNYTILLDKDISFGSPDFVYATSPITNTSFVVSFALDANAAYYWKVIAYDVFESSTNSTDFFRYVTDTIAPTAILTTPQNASFSNSASIQFMYVPNDTNTVASCTLYLNISGSLSPNITNYTISKENTNSLPGNLPENTYLWTVRCNDSAQNSRFASTNNTLFVDLTAPSVLQVSPANNSIYNESNTVLFEANATDRFQNMTSCSLVINGIVESTNPAIQNGVTFNFTNFMTNGNYSWRINCTDYAGNVGYSAFRNLTVLVVDTEPPIIMLNRPLNNESIPDSSFTFNYTPEDATGITNCSIILDGILNQTNASVIRNVPNYFTITSFTEQQHNWSVSCFDNSTGLNPSSSATQNFTVDLTNPAVTLNAPANASYIGSSSVSFNFTPTDSRLQACSLYGNFSGSFSLNDTNMSASSGIPNYFQKNVADGRYIWNVLCNDSSSRSAFAPSNFTLIIDTSPPQHSGISVFPESPQNYSVSRNYTFNVSWSDGSGVDTVFLESNFTGTLQNVTLALTAGAYNFTIAGLTAGNYTYAWVANDSAGNQNRTQQYYYFVAPTASTIDLKVNGSDSNTSIREDTSANLSAILITPASGFVEIYVDGIMWANGSSPLHNTTFFAEPRVYEILARYPATQNFSEAFDSINLTVNDTTQPNVTLLSPQNNSFVGSSSVTFQYNVTDSSNISSCSLYINGLFNASEPDVTRNVTATFSVTLPTGNHSWRVACTDYAGNLGVSATNNFSRVNSDSISVNVSSSKQRYEKGESAEVMSSSKDVFGNVLISNMTTDMILGNTTLGWWNTSWKKRIPLLVNHTFDSARSETIEVNVTGINSSIGHCNELRVVTNYTINSSPVHGVVPSLIVGSNNESCMMRFNINLTSGMSDALDYHIYLNNSAASGDPGFSFNRTGTWVQRGTVSGTGVLLTASPDVFSMQNSFVLFTANTGSSNPDRNQFTPRIDQNNEISFDRYDGTTSSVLTWQLIESTDISAQRGSLSFAATDVTANATISPVNLSSSFIIVYGRVNSGTNSQNNIGFFMARFINSTAISVERGTTGVAATAYWQVVDWNGAVVNSGNHSFTAQTGNASMGALNLSTSFLVMSRAIAGATSIAANMIRGSFINGTNLEFRRIQAAGTAHVSWFAVQLPSHYSVQGSTNSYATDTNVELQPVVMEKTFNVQSWNSGGTASTAYLDTLQIANITNTTNLLFDKQSATQTFSTAWFVVESRIGTMALSGLQEFIQRNQSETNILGQYSIPFSTYNMSYGNYSAVSLASRSNFTNGSSAGHFEIVPDRTPPNVTLLAPPHLEPFGTGFFNFSYIPYDINLANCTLYIRHTDTFAPNASNLSPLNNGTNNFTGIYAAAGLHDWNVRCSDSEGNSGFAWTNFTLNVTGPDLLIGPSRIYFGPEQRIEGVNITVFANVSNIGLSPTNGSFIVQFFHNDPDSGGTQISGNITITELASGQYAIVSANYTLEPGINQIYVRLDFNDSINESDESNNEAYSNASVPLYQYYYGNVTKRIVLGDFNQAFTSYYNMTVNYTGFVFFADKDSSFSFTDLQAITRNVNNASTANDFTDIDAALNSTGLNDSIKAVWGAGTDTSVQATAMNLSSGRIDNVPTANSTNSSTFVTGILWDTADDASVNLQYDSVDREDLVFVTKVNETRQGFYGTYDYEVRIPSPLKSYKAGEDKVVFYVELE